MKKLLASIKEGGLCQQGRSMGRGNCMHSHVRRMMLGVVTNWNNIQCLKQNRRLFLACEEFKRVFLYKSSALFLSFREPGFFHLTAHLTTTNDFYLHCASLHQVHWREKRWGRLLKILNLAVMCTTSKRIPLVRASQSLVLSVPHLDGRGLRNKSPD